MNPTEKIMAILEEVSLHQKTGLFFTEVARNINIPKSTVHRVLMSLKDLGYLILNEETKKYRCSLKLTRLGSRVVEYFDLREFVHPFLEELHRKTRHICHLGVLCENFGIYLDKIETSEHEIQTASKIGKEFPLHCTGLGKTILAYMNPSARRKILGKTLEARTPNSITNPQTLEKELLQIAKNGFSIDREEVTRGIMCVAAPVKNYNEDFVAAISVTFPSYLYQERSLDFEIEAVMQIAFKTSQMMGSKNSDI